ncbi:tetratricopeptide repeat protein [Deefgea tanakiae]|uniref:Tetratricopeptide repeat protein n=1 Tax=Deefgea tanakiae TaxID=2865840 RepID=A0ABX8Z4W5_9NEIS|nr:tetratricopeptide repeat protein [Deefgea tanakiae]QZA76835.1 tetratricopeptide repeat protein [Deefgea tanakiae]
MTNLKFYQQLIESGKAQQAISSIEKNIKKQPKSDSLWVLLGAAHQTEDNLEKAERAFKMALQINPRNIDAKINLATIYVEQFQLVDAKKLILELEKLAKNLPLIWRLKSRIFMIEENYKESFATTKIAIRLEPDNIEYWYELVSSAINGNLDAHIVYAFTTASKSISKKSEFISLQALIFARLHLIPFEDAFQYTLWQPKSEDELLRRTMVQSSLLLWAGAFADAAELLEILIPQYTNLIECRALLGIAQLATKNWKDGWKNYAHRSQKKTLINSLKIPVWTGESLSGKRLLIHGEQGAGDVIQFIRYIKCIEQTALKVSFNCSPDMLPLFGKDAINEANQNTTFEADTIFDFQTRLLDLPQWVKFEDTQPTPYIQIDMSCKKKWAAILGNKENIRIGIVWAGNPNHAGDFERSAALLDFESLFTTSGISWYSLQKGVAAQNELNDLLNTFPIVDLSSHIYDFSDTAAIISELDLLLTVDTSVAHLAGALNTPTWVLLSSFSPDWRWDTEQNSSDWYPSIQTFRKKEISWQNFISSEIKNKLKEFFHLTPKIDLKQATNSYLNSTLENFELLKNMKSLTTDEILKALNEILSTHKRHLESLLLRAHILIQQQQFEHALLDICAACRWHPDNSNAKMLMADWLQLFEKNWMLNKESLTLTLLDIE